MSFRKFNKTLCMLSLASLYTFTTYGATLTDVTSAHWAYSAIVDLESKGIMSLNSSGQFFPNQMMDYFEIADVMAKATGYVDADVNKNADATFVSQIAANYEKQKPTLQSYASKYTKWNSAYNQQIAYLLGRGYLTKTDLDKFITKSGTTETKNAITKEDLSIFVVRMLGKAVTATQEYKTTGFKDENSISTEARPYMAYLKNVGILTADAAGNGNGKSKVTKALCAKMIDSALQIKENTTTGNTTAGNTNAAENTTNNAGTQTAVVKKVLTKNTTEYYLLLQMGSNTSYYSIKNTTKILDASGKEVAITKLSGETINVTIKMEGSTEYITSVKITAPGEGNNTNTNNNTDANTNTNTNTNTNVNNNTANGTVTNSTVVSGTLTQVITNGICRMNLSDGTAQTYILDDNCSVTLDGKTVDASEIPVGSTIAAASENSVIKKLQAISGSSVQLSYGEVLEKKLANGQFTLKLRQNGKEAEVSIPDTAVVTRNAKEAEVSNIRIGDTVNLTQTNGTITGVQVTSTRTKAEGTISQLIIGSTTQVVVNVNKVPTTYTIATDAEIFDITKNKVISARDLHLGQKATLLMDSKEVISLDVDSDTDSVNLMGTITKVGKRASYIDVLVDYDYITNESKVYKRIELSDNIKVVLNGKSRDIYDLGPDMNVVISYTYLDDSKPQKITIIS